jgi:hypothetical protein
MVCPTSLQFMHVYLLPWEMCLLSCCLAQWLGVGTYMQTHRQWGELIKRAAADVCFLLQVAILRWEPLHSLELWHTPSQCPWLCLRWQARSLTLFPSWWVAFWCKENVKNVLLGPFTALDTFVLTQPNLEDMTFLLYLSLDLEDSSSSTLFMLFLSPSRQVL